MTVLTFYIFKIYISLYLVKIYDTILWRDPLYHKIEEGGVGGM
jgi:hypothetical protein